MKKILTVNGFDIVWLSKEVRDEKAFMTEFKDRLIACYKQDWHSKLEDNDKYSWFHSFKNIFQPELFLRSVTNKWHRSMLARFRSRTLGFKANRNWFSNEASTNNGCPLCPGYHKEDEEHFVFYCKAYEEVRRKSRLFNVISQRPHSIVELLGSDDVNIICLFAKFIADCYATREKKMSASVSV